MSCPNAQADDTGTDRARRDIAARAEAIQPKLLEWRRDIHAHPELGNQEFRTAKLVAKHLRGLGLEVRSGVAKTGVVAVLRGALPGPAVALRADMDALPVKESLDLPFASKAKGMYRGQEVDVMHACGHDAHTAILMAVADILAGLRERLPGTVVFYFQPAEEGPSDYVPNGSQAWGAKLMIREGAMDNPKPEAVFGLHVWAGLPSGHLLYRAGPTMASSDDLHIRIIGKQTHAARPWNGVDPITVGAQALLGLQTVVSRQTDISAAPAVISIGSIHGGNAYNIIPESLAMDGTIRAFDAGIRQGMHEKIHRTVEHIAASAGAEAQVKIVEKYDPTVNDAALLDKMLPTLAWAANGDTAQAPLISGAEDFSFYAQQAPGLFFFLGITPAGQDPALAASNHNPGFYIDEAALVVGVRAMAGLASDYLHANAAPAASGNSLPTEP